MRRVLPTLLLSWVVGGPASPLRAQDEPADAPEAPERPAAELVREGNARFADGALDEALGFYDRARNQAPDSAELAFNRGLTHFKLGHLEQAGELLNRSVSSPDRDVEADSKFMLGNVQHLRAVQAREQDPRAAMEALEQATRYYLDALAVRPENEQLRGNIELAQNLMELIREEQQQQQQQDQQPNQEQQQQDGEEQESEQQPDQGQEQEQDPQQQQEEQDPESEEQEKQEGEQQEEGEQEQQSQESSGEPAEPKDGEEQQSPQPAEPEEGEEGEARRLPPEQIERMMQQIRDKERQRRQQKAEQARRRAGTVKKDW